MNKLDQNWNFKKLLKFALPSIIMVLFLSVYTIIDAGFVARYVGDVAIGAVNIVYPFVSLNLAVAFMVTSGSNAYVSKLLGENKKYEAKEKFSFIVIVMIIFGLVITLFGVFNIDLILKILHSSEGTYPYAKVYLFYYCLFIIPNLLMIIYQSFFITSGIPKLGLFCTVISGLINIVLDYIFIAIMGYGVFGAIMATGIGYSFSAVVGTIYFFRNKKGNLSFVKFIPDFKMMFKSLTNGSSEMVSNVSMAITTFIFNEMMMRFVGDTGVAAISIILYIQFVQLAIFFGYSQGVAPIVGYAYGSNNYQRVKKLLNIALKFVISLSIVVFLISEIFTGQIVGLFFDVGSDTYNITYRGLKLFSFSYLFTGMNIYLSSFFTSLSNGRVSAFLSFVRTFVFIVSMLYLLPNYFGLTGVWIATPIAELLSLVLGVIVLIKQNKNYHYF
jgi:putative MATE family efflux protein